MILFFHLFSFTVTPERSILHGLVSEARPFTTLWWTDWWVYESYYWQVFSDEGGVYESSCNSDRKGMLAAFCFPVSLAKMSRSFSWEDLRSLLLLGYAFLHELSSILREACTHYSCLLSALGTQAHPAVPRGSPAASSVWLSGSLVLCLHLLAEWTRSSHCSLLRELFSWQFLPAISVIYCFSLCLTM